MRFVEMRSARSPCSVLSEIRSAKLELSLTSVSPARSHARNRFSLIPKIRRMPARV